MEPPPSSPKTVPADNLTCKVYVKNINKNTNSKTLEEHFRKFGPIVDLSLMMEAHTGLNRGYAFVTFENDKHADDCLMSPSQFVDDRELELRRVIPKNIPDPMLQTRTNRIFLGGLPQRITEENVTDYFNEKYSNLGEVSEVVIKKDRQTGRPRGFCFVAFKSHHAVDKIIVQNRFPEICDKRCEVRKADPSVPITGAPPPGVDGRGNAPQQPSHMPPMRANGYYGGGNVGGGRHHHHVAAGGAGGGYGQRVDSRYGGGGGGGSRSSLRNDSSTYRAGGGPSAAAHHPYGGGAGGGGMDEYAAANMGYQGYYAPYSAPQQCPPPYPSSQQHHMAAPVAHHHHSSSYDNMRAVVAAAGDRYYAGSAATAAGYGAAPPSSHSYDNSHSVAAAAAAASQRSMYGGGNASSGGTAPSAATHSQYQDYRGGGSYATQSSGVYGSQAQSIGSVGSNAVQHGGGGGGGSSYLGSQNVSSASTAAASASTVNATGGGAGGGSAGAGSGSGGYGSSYTHQNSAAAAQSVSYPTRSYRPPVPNNSTQPTSSTGNIQHCPY